LNFNLCCSLVDTRSVSAFVFFLWRKPKKAPKGCEAKAEHHRSPSGDDWGEPTT